MTDDAQPRDPGEGETARSQEDARDDARTYQAGWRMVGFGWEFLSHVIAGLLLGWGVDWAFGARPWGLAGGAVAGVLVGGVQFVRRALAMNRQLGPVRRPPGGWRTVDELPTEPDLLGGDGGDDGRERGSR